MAPTRVPKHTKRAQVGKGVHGLIHLVGRELAVYLLHGLAGLLHRQQRLLVDIGRLDRVYLLLQRSDLGLGLLEAVLMRLLTLQRGLCSYPGGKISGQ